MNNLKKCNCCIWHLTFIHKWNIFILISKIFGWARNIFVSNQNVYTFYSHSFHLIGYCIVNGIVLLVKRRLMIYVYLFSFSPCILYSISFEIVNLSDLYHLLNNENPYLWNICMMLRYSCLSIWFDDNNLSIWYFSFVCV